LGEKLSDYYWAGADLDGLIDKMSNEANR